MRRIRKRLLVISATRPVRVVHEMIRIFIDAHVMRSAASLSYFLTMSIFPLLLCATAVLGSLNISEMAVFDLFEDIIPDAAITVISDFLKYVSGNMSRFMLIVGLTTMVTTSSAALRTMMGIMGDIQGRKRFYGLFGHIASLLMSPLLLVAVYASGLIIMTGEWFVHFLSNYIYILDVARVWLWLRFVLLFAVMLAIIYGLYIIASPKRTKVIRILPGALTATALMVAASALFSQIISASARYAVVYGSLASIIIMMVWMYACAAIIILGNVFNVALVRTKSI